MILEWIEAVIAEMLGSYGCSSGVHGQSSRTMLVALGTALRKLSKRVLVIMVKYV
jgi:hypothetical protein